MRKTFLLFLGVLVLTILPLAAQGGTASMGYWMEVDLTQAAKYEEGVKAHAEWHRSRGDTWGYDVWQQVAGEEGLGTFYAGMAEAPWADYDKLAEYQDADTADFVSRVGSSMISVRSTISSTLTELSKMPEGPVPAGALAEVVTFYIKPGRMEQMLSAIAQFHAAIQKSDWENPYIWSVEMAGGAPRISLILPRPNWASFAQQGNAFEIVQKQLGLPAALTTRETFNDAIRRVSSSVWRYRQDLSYVP